MLCHSYPDNASKPHSALYQYEVHCRVHNMIVKHSSKQIISSRNGMKKSPVKCRFKSLHWKRLCAYLPPAALPFLCQKHGTLVDGSLKAATAFTPILFSPSVSPMLIVVFPSPAGCWIDGCH